MAVTDPITTDDCRAAVLAVEEHGGIRPAARALGVNKSFLHRRVRRAEALGITAHGEVSASPPADLAPAAPGQTRRFLLTSAQNNTGVHEPFWRNLLALADHDDAQILAARFRYNHSAQHVAQEKDDRSADSDLWYAKALEDHFDDRRVRLAPGLIWAGDMNILPTAVNPLSGMDSFMGSDSVVFPHPQIALRSVATAPATPTKFNYTTGSVTLTNYIGRKAGLKAEFHHAFGALLVEVAPDGTWFTRQINAGADGVICDLDRIVSAGKVTTGNRVDVLVPGDIHGELIDPACRRAIWGPGGVVEVCRPRVQYLHDILNFGRRSHHNGVFDRIEAHYAGAEDVEAEVKATASILSSLTRPDMDTVVVKSNHDEHFERWLAEVDFRRDPVNASFFLDAAAARVRAIKDRNRRFDLVRWAMQREGVTSAVQFLSRDERSTVRGIRYDMHGDIGPNGARGSAVNIAKTGEKTVIGHSHSAAIVQGCYQVGTSSLLDMGYNTGPSSWSHTLCLTYATGKRALLTIVNGNWRA